ncbi:hypothetical protein [Paraclostridium dentum]|uniref:hypothetical protein n=1 Tax=Paraclostridium dentum TaxID=2662455 RepID=UPI001472B7BC|nr:hypothetical protein [Paraclostridium dentum]
MDCFNYKIFISYTVRGGLITIENLNRFRNNLNQLGILNVYIDILDNNNVKNPQEKVINELKSSTLVCLIDTPCINKSPWVNRELLLSNCLSKPIIKIPFNNFLTISSETNLLNLYKDKHIISILNHIVKK